MKHKLYVMLAGLLLFSFQLKAQSPDAFNYQGVARDLTGAVLSSKIISVRFTIHKGSASGSISYEETQLVTTNQFGLFSVAIGTGSIVSGSLSGIAWGSNVYFLQVEMDPAGGSNYTTMGTSEFLSVPYTLYADTAAHSNSSATSVYSDTAAYARNANAAPSVWTTTGANIYNSNAGSVGVGISTPTDSASLDVFSSHKYGARFQSDSASDLATTINSWYTGTGSYNGSAVNGTSLPSDGYGIGANFTGGYIGSTSLASGISSAFSYYGASNFSAALGASSTAYGSFSSALTNGGTAYGVVGTATEISSGTAYGLYGSASSSTGVAYGFYGVGSPVGGYGGASGTGISYSEMGSPYGSQTFVSGLVGEVKGLSTNSAYQNDGVLGIASSPGTAHSAGVMGYGTAATGTDIGLWGLAQGLGTENYSIAVYGYENPAQGGGSAGSYIADYAGYFIGDMYVSGTLTASTKNFKIDDPLDPANKYLYHDCVESPDMMNIYNGNVVTDAKGNATITLPNYFQALNGDFKYQLTVIGQFAQAIVSSEINNNQFAIKTDKPNVKVSWQVTGVRIDPWANNNRTVVEVPKKGIERGHYLFPQYYGQPQSLSITNLISGATPTMQNLNSLRIDPNPQAPTKNGSSATPVIK